MNLFCSLSSSGGDKRDRTADLLTASQTLSQLSYTPMIVFHLVKQTETQIILANEYLFVNGW